MRYDVGRFRRPMRRGVMEQMVSLISLGDGSTLSLDFTTGVLDPRLTFTRSTTGTFINSSGYVTSAAINAPRFDYDPTTLQPRGLLIEGSATNLARRSDDFNTTVTDGTQWVAAGYTAGTLSTTLPDGTTGNARRISIASGSGSFRSADITVTASTAYTFSFWARNNGGSQARFRVWNVTAGSSIVDYTQSINNYVSQIGGANNTSSTWVRVSVQFTTPAGCTAIYVYPTSSDAGTVDLLIWGAQVEAGSVSSYIPTVASTATRAADNCYADSISSWYTQGSGTMLFFGRPTVPSTRTMLTFSVGTNVPRIQMYGSTSTDVVCFLENPSGTGANIVFPSGTLVNGTAFKSAWAFETGNHAACINAGTVATASTSSPAVPSSGITRLNIGMRYDGFNQFNGHVISAKYWPTRLANATLQAITTL